jgi:hypothetical protein
MPRHQVRRFRSRPRDGAILWLVRRTCFQTPTPHPIEHTRVPLTTPRSSISIVCRRECVLDFCRDSTHVYPRAPARTTARRSDPRSRKGRPRSRAAREQYVQHSPCLSRSWQSLYSLTSLHPFLDLSDKNPLVELPYDASVVALLAVFSTGTHRGTSTSSWCSSSHTYHNPPVLVKSPAGSSESHLGMISDRRLLAYFSAFARSLSGAVPPLPSIKPSSSFLRYVSNPLGVLPLPSLNLHLEVVAVHSGNTVLDAMGMMSDLGVSSVAVLVEEGGSLLSAISVTDIGQVGAITWYEYVVG